MSETLQRRIPWVVFALGVLFLLPSISSATSVTGQTISAELGFPRKLSVGEFDITNLMVAYTDSPVFEYLGLTRRPALLLGMRELKLFKRVAIDFAANRIYFDLPELGS